MSQAIKHTKIPGRLQTTARNLSFFSLFMSSLAYLKLEFFTFDIRLVVYGFKLLAGAYSPFTAILGAAGAILGLVGRVPAAVAAGLTSLLISISYIRSVTRPRADFSRAFGPNWEFSIRRKMRALGVNLLPRRWLWFPLRSLPEVNMYKDRPFWRLDNGRVLCCDLWQPAGKVKPSRLAVIYFHGGGWQSLDKDHWTRPAFRYLAAQGHLVMDVSYRLVHETDLIGITGDVKRAIVWLKRNAARLGVNPERIVLAGGSAGGHLALLGAYTPNHQLLDPDELNGEDTSVAGVVSFYGLPDLRNLDEYSEGARSNRTLATVGRWLGLIEPEGYYDPPDLARKLFDNDPKKAALLSPLLHAGPHCPPTLLLQGLHDHIVREDDVRLLHQKLLDAGASSVLVELPQVEHGFDLLGLNISPSAQSALYDMERFLALLI